jgi:hypothetical protein
MDHLTLNNKMNSRLDYGSDLNQNNDNASLFMKHHQDIINEIFQAKYKRISSSELDVIGL